MQDEPTSLRIDDPGVRALFTESARFQSWLDVEAALALAQAELGIIPDAAAREIVRKAHLKYLDLVAVREGLARTGHPLVPLVWALDRACEGDAGGYVHWGATTQNITQTGQLLQVRRAHAIFLRQLATILTTLADLAERTKDALLPGRTHGQHAVPATFGFKVAVWIDELGRHVERLHGCEGRVFVAMLGGGAGTLASLGEPGLATQEKMAARLGMRAMPVPARTIGDHQAEYVMLLGMLAATGSKIGREIYTLMKQEFGEVEEPVPAGTVGSSTMPQKRNPKLSQDIIAAAAQIRALVPLALEAMQTEHEADRTTSIMMSRALVQACELTGDMLQRTVVLFEGLQVFPERMRENLDLSGGLIMAEALMLELGKQIGRQRAHDAVYEAAQASVVQSRPFLETLAEDPHVSAGLTAPQVEALLDPARYTGLCRQFAERGAAAGREIAASIARRAAAIVMMLLVCWSALLHSSSAVAAEPIKVGAVLPFSGGVELYGNQAKLGLDLAAKEINATGGVLGRPLTILYEDDKTDPEVAEKATRKLIERDGVLAVVGPITSRNLNAIKATIEHAKTPLLYATNYEGGACSRYIFSFSSVPNQELAQLLPFMHKTFGTSYFLLGADRAWPHKMFEAAEPLISRLGGRVVGKEFTTGQERTSRP